MFSLSLHKTGSGIQNKIVFGNYNLTKYANKNTTEDDIIWAELATEANKDNWAVALKGVSFAGSDTPLSN